MPETPLGATAETPKIPEISYIPLTLSGWATHYGVGTKELTLAMRIATKEIFESDKELTRNADDADFIRRRKRELTELHRGRAAKSNSKLLILSQGYQGIVRRILARELPKEPHEYLNVKQLLPKFPKANFEQLVKVTNMMRMRHPEWYCRTKHTNGGRPTYGLLKAYEAAFKEEADIMITEHFGRRWERNYDIAPVATDTTKRLTWWGINDERAAVREIGWERWWSERYE